VPSWLVFEAVSTKLPHYTMPMYPALMLLGAAWAMDPLRRLPARWWRWFALAALALAALGLALVAEAAGWFLVREPFGPGVLLLPLGALLVWVVARAAWRGAWGRAGLLGALLAVPIYAVVLEGVAARLEPLWIAPRLAEVLRARAPGLASRDFGITGHSEPSVLFAVGGETSLLRTGGDAARFLAAGPGRVVAVGDRAERDFQREAGTLALALQEIGQVTGFNYTRGRWVTLMLIRRAP
jgi:hypothetical protein